MQNSHAAFNDGTHIVKIMDTTDCKKHNVPKGVPCWHIFAGASSSGRLPAICGRRIRKAGFNGQITQTSMQLRRSSKKN